MRRGRPRGERGAVAVEFALVLPVLLLLVLGGIDWGYFFFAGEVVANAAREGARAASLMPGSVADPCVNDAGMPGARPVVISYLRGASLMNSDTDTRLLPWDCTAVGQSCCRKTTLDVITPGAPAVDVVQVRVAYQARAGTMSLTGFLPWWLLPSSAAATAVMRVEP